jgi:hypothetical protein
MSDLFPTPLLYLFGYIFILASIVFLDGFSAMERAFACCRRRRRGPGEWRRLARDPI